MKVTVHHPFDLRKHLGLFLSDCVQVYKSIETHLVAVFENWNKVSLKKMMLELVVGNAN